jgi:hypothetical protein
MNKPQIAALFVAVCALLAVNLAAPFVSMHWKGVQHPVGSEAVSVYPVEHTDRASSSPSVAVTDPSKNFSPTGERVMVYIRNDYRADDIKRIPYLTIWLLIGFTALFAIVSRFTAKP